MPLFGALELGEVAARLPVVPDLDTEAWTLPQAEILQLAWEVNDDTQVLLPKAMHPAIPPYATLLVTRYPDTPVGAFALAQLRLMGRAGAHPRGYVLGAVASTEAAASALRERWGFPVQGGEVTLRRYHDRIVARVTLGGEAVLDAALLNPEPISGADVQYIHTVTLASTEGRPQLIQVDPHYTIHKAERGRPRLERLAASRWNAGGLGVTTPIAATITTCDTDLPRIRFVMDPEIPVVRGTRRIR
ncbi:MAG TPA: acetoacetate decarboxylase family protein [Methylomirabilota bacterium]|jgi:hypothetical protein